MFRSIRASIPLVARRALPSTHSPQVVNLYQARVRRPVFKKFVASCIVGYFSWKIFQNVVLVPRMERIVEELNKLEDEGEVEVDDWSIPLPVFEAVRQLPYSRGSPEWQRMIAFSQNSPENRKQREMLWREITNLVRDMAVNSKWLNERFGKVTGETRSSLTILYPPHPPPKILQLVWVPFPSDGGPSLRTRRTDLLAWRRNERTFVPVHVAYASVAFLRSLLESTVADGRAALGYPAAPVQESPRPISILPQLPPLRQPPRSGADDGSDAAQAAGRPSAGKGAPASPSRGTDSRTSADSPAQAATSADRTISKPRSRADDGAGRGTTGLGGQQQHQEQDRRAPGQVQVQDDEDDKAQLPLFKRVPDPTTLVDKGTRIRAFSSFMDELSKRWRLPPNLPPEGCVAVTGLVHLNTDRFYLQLDVVAYYDLVKQQIDRQSMRVQLREIGARRALRP